MEGMKIKPWLIALLFIAFFSLGCAGMQEQKTAAIELEGNPTTGYTWVYAMSPEGVVREVSNKYIADRTNDGRVGSGGKFVFTFEAVAEGDAGLTFSYLRLWEEGIAPIKTVNYRATVDDKNSLTLTQMAQ